MLTGLLESQLFLDTVVSQPGINHFWIEGNQRRNERLLVSGDDDLSHDGVRPNGVFQVVGGNVFTTSSNDDFLFATGDGEVSLIIKVPDVSGLEPAIISEGLFGGSFVLPVASEDVDALNLDFTVVGNADRYSRQSGPSGADLESGHQVFCCRCCGLGEPIAFQNFDA